MMKIWIVALIAVSLFACRKAPPIKTTIVPAGLPVTVTLNQAQRGSVIPSNFQGLSFETELLGQNPEFLNVNNTVLIQLIKNLGPGMFRIGGDSSDETNWTGKERTSSTPDSSLTTTDIDRLSAFVKVTGWQVLFGLNLGNHDAPAASDEAQYASNGLASSLYAFESGNEPDVYYMFGLRSGDYNFINYQSDWEYYLGAVKSKLPQASFGGPGTAYNTDWITFFADNENKNVKLIDAHYYVAGPASVSSINYHTILNPDYKLNYFLRILGSSSQKHHLPYRVTECNNIYGGGKAGVSDVFASALWTLDIMWNIAANNGQGINLHGGTNLFYSPIMMINGAMIARPEYYAMLAFRYGSANGTFIPTNISNQSFNCSVYACANKDNTESITLINKDESDNFSFTLQMGKNVQSIQVMRLSAPSITSTTGITLAGSTVNTDGTFNPGPTEDYTVNGNSFVVNVKAGSAAIITVK